MKVKPPFRIETREDTNRLTLSGHTVCQYLGRLAPRRRGWWVWAYINGQGRVLSKAEMRWN